MSDMEETEGTEGTESPGAPHRVIGTPPPSPRLLGSAAVPQEQGAVALAADAEEAEEFQQEHIAGLPPDDPRVIVHGRRAERVVAACFIIAFIAGCGFVAAYVGLGVHTVDKTLRSNLALGFSLSVALLALGLGALIWVRHLMPDVEVVQARHDLRSDEKERQATEAYFKEGTANSQFVKRPIVRRTLMLGTLPLIAAPVVLLRDLGPQPGTSLRHTVWSPGRRLLIQGTNTPITPAQFSAPGSMITIVPDGYEDNQDELAKAAVILIKFEPGQLRIPTRHAGSTLVGTMNWTVDNIVAYSKICTHVGCPVALYEQTTHHILCPCHQSTFDAPTGATVIFGPAARPLPQLPLTTDAQGYLVAKSDFTEPVGPS
ncbi:MAG TPA: Rieske 2Fe-2S domain-containing protein, partial [Streptosporangiaceae bacterium]|nr:Rieske 2Fe-2S domain-containing protein [Streptosporangiaceae bacterium]